MKRFRILAAGIISLLAASFANAQTIVVIAEPFLGMVLESNATSTAQKVPVVRAPYSNKPNQRWTLHSAGGGKYYIYNAGDGRALEATTFDEYAPLYAADLSWEDTRQMWRFGPGFGSASRSITSAFNGLIVATDVDNYEFADSQVIQTRSGSVFDRRLESWLVIPVHSVPTCQYVTAVHSQGTGSPANRLDVSVFGLRNALRVAVWIWPEATGPDSGIWRYLPYGWGGWSRGFDVDSDLPSATGSYCVDTWALGADNEWHYLRSSWVTLGQRAQPERPATQ